MIRKTYSRRSHAYIILFALLLVAAVALGVNGCSGDSHPSAPTKPREYTWRVDTIYVPNSSSTEMYALWGFSTSDVYIGGDLRGYAGKIWHFDGARWTPLRLSTEEGGTIPSMGNIRQLHGTNDGTLYGVGERGDFTAFMIRYRNGRWTDISPDSTRLLNSVFASDQSNVWVGGINGTVLHFDDNAWRFTPQALPLAIPPDADPFWVNRSLAGGVGNNPALLISVSLQSKYYFLELAGGAWRVFDSTDNTRRQLWYSPEGTLWAVGYGVHRWKGDSWESMYPELSVFGISGTSDKNIFVVGRYGTTARVFHFDGNDWFRFEQAELPNATFYKCWTNGIGLFVVGVLDGSPGKSIVLQGR